MRDNKIDRHKVIIFVRRYGKPFRFYRFKKDDYGEPSENIESINIQGVFHVGSIYVSQNTNDGSKSRSKPQPQILALFEDSIGIANGDILKYRGNTFKVIELQDLNNWGIALDISLELVDSGTRF